MLSIKFTSTRDARGMSPLRLATANKSGTLQELKQPVTEAVTASGWIWQPVMWNAPGNLRWLVE
jgi:hypothetical protein